MGRAPAISAAKQMMPERSRGHGERGDEDRGRRGQQTPGGDRAFDRAPGEHDARRDDRFRAQSVVERQPERQEHQRPGPQRKPVAAQRDAETRSDLAAEHPPAQDSGGQRR